MDGQDDPNSVPGRLLHWDAEWHWDATYGQYAHQALGGHILALGLSEAYQIWGSTQTDPRLGATTRGSPALPTCNILMMAFHRNSIAAGRLSIP